MTRLAIATVSLFAVAAAYGAPCLPVTTLDTYVALGAVGCQISGLTISDVAFTSAVLFGAPPVLSDSDVTVSSGIGSGFFDMNFSAAFAAPAGTAVDYVLEYTIDPPPIVIHRFAEEMFVDSPVFPGTADIFVDLCLGAAWVGLVCPTGDTASFTVFDHDGVDFLHSDEVSFIPVFILGVRKTISLDAAAGGSSDFTSFGSTTHYVPEPAGWVLAFAGLALGMARLGGARSKTTSENHTERARQTIHSVAGWTGVRCTWKPIAWSARTSRSLR